MTLSSATPETLRRRMFEGRGKGSHRSPSPRSTAPAFPTANALPEGATQRSHRSSPRVRSCHGVGELPPPSGGGTGGGSVGLSSPHPRMAANANAMATMIERDEIMGCPGCDRHGGPCRYVGMERGRDQDRAHSYFTMVTRSTAVPADVSARTK